MATVLFDLDETLGDLHTPFGYLMILKYLSYFLDVAEEIDEVKYFAASVQLEDKMNEAYDLFVNLILEKEKQGLIGILRSGILPLFEKLEQLKQIGKIKRIVIYSNNGNLFSLRLVSDLLSRYTKDPELFCSLVHWRHPMREPEIVQGQPGWGKKTWDVISQIIQEECGELPLPETTIFVDDQEHPDMMRVLGSNYLKVTPYKYHVPAIRLDLLFEEALKKTGLISDPEFYTYLSQNDVSKARNFQELLHTVHSLTGRTARYNSKQPNVNTRFVNSMNRAIESVLEVVDQIHSDTESTPLLRGGKRTTRRKPKNVLKKKERKSRK